jgi:hypothetical protein
MAGFLPGSAFLLRDFILQISLWTSTAIDPSRVGPGLYPEVSRDKTTKSVTYEFPPKNIDIFVLTTKGAWG